MIVVGSWLVVAGRRRNSTVETLDTHRTRVWNLPPFGNRLERCILVTLADQITAIGGYKNPTCATVPLIEKNSLCFRRLCEQYHVNVKKSK